MQQPKTEKKENESVRGLKIVLDALKKSGHGPESEAAKKINALIKKYE